MDAPLKILIVDNRVIPLTLSVIRCLGTQKELNFEIHVLALNSKKISPIRFSRYVKSYYNINATTDEEIFMTIISIAKEVEADILVPVDEKVTRIIAERDSECREIIQHTPIPQPHCLEKVRNKWLLYSWLFDMALINDEPIKYSDISKGKVDPKTFKYPFLIKPFWGSGGKGIVMIGDIDQFKKFKPHSTFGEEGYLICPYIDGYDIDLSALVINGEIISYTIQKSIAKKSELIYSKSVEFIENEVLLQQAVSIFRALKYTGIAHLDFRFDIEKSKYILIDFNARYWSSLLASLSVGINFPLISCQIAMNQNYRKPNYSKRNYYMTNNIVELLFSHISIKESEFQFTIADPLPIFIQFYLWSINYLINTFYWLTRRKNL